LRNVETLFHEFWHALHAMLADSKYAYLNWFNIEWDFVELPSQLMENWVSERESLVSLSKHYLTWESLPSDILDKLDELKTFMMWYFVARQNELALVDNSLYQWKIPENIEELDQKILDEVNKYSYFQRWDEYKMYCAFLHIFGWGYEAQYYSYMWA
jgi:peptidyl-dipeptidase Dcp